MKTKKLVASVILFLGIVFIASGQVGPPPPVINFYLISGNDRQTICENLPISTITYAITPSETTSVSGLPSGVTWSILGDLLTISGTPTNAGTYNYVVSAYYVQLTGILTVTAKTIPIFSQLAPINSGGTLAALPTTSTNGIAGTWLPAPNNTATTTYTFIPSVGQCANNTTMTVAVNTTPTPTQNLCIRDTQSYSVNTTDSSHMGSTYAWSISPTIPNIIITGQGTNSITIDWSNAPYGSYTLQTVETNTAGCLSTPVNATINLTQPTTPTFTQVSPICSGATLTALPTTSNNGITGTWLPAINNAATTTYTFTPTAGLCGTTATMTIVVNPNVTPTFTQISPVCSGATLTALPTTSNNGVSGTWLPAVNPNITTTYTFTPTAGQCASTTTQTIIITAPVVTSPISFVAPAPVSALPSVTIGTQVWTNKNLDVTTYRDGTPIPQVTDPTAWVNLTTGAWCYYNNDPSTNAVYGKLYNWYAVNDPRGLAPAGYHVPSDAEWTTLTNFLGGDAVAGGKMKTTGTIQEGTGLWLEPNSAATNESGFSGLPVGYRYHANGLFDIFGTVGWWWSSSESNSTDSLLLALIDVNSTAFRDDRNKRSGFSVRCLRD